MENLMPILRRTRLFAGLGEEDIAAMLDCLQAEVRQFAKGSYIFRQGEMVDKITVVLVGKLHIQKDDFWGNRSILGVIEPGEICGEAYAASQSGGILHDVVAVEESRLVFFDVKKILTVCPNSCRFHCLVVQNLFFILSEKNRKLVQKLGHMAQRTTREKLLSYLSEEAARQNAARFEIPFNRQQLADFLSVDRSAMSNELSKMRDEGLIQFEKNQFVLL